MLIIKAISVLFVVNIVYAVSDPCASLKCEKPNISCLKLISGKRHATFKCECAENCDNVNIINVPVVQRIRPETLSKKLSFNAKRPTLKQGGAACYPNPNYCENGGTCYTQYTQTKTPINTTTKKFVNVYATNPTKTTTTTTTTKAPETTTHYTFVTQPVCGCQPAYSGDRCEIPMTTPIVANPVTTTVSWNNLCKIYADRNMNICQNGGQCVFISDGKIACVCPSMFIGQYCETPVYTKCLGTGNAQCHRDYGTCQPDGLCLCRAGYCGMSCDQRITETTTVASKCQSHLCQNGGTCKQVNVDPYVVCICPTNYTGSRCETFVDQSTTTMPYIQSYTKLSATRQQRCNFTIAVQNDGLYTARFKVSYSIDGIPQPTIQSENMYFVTSKKSITIPYHATDIVVDMERLGFFWSTIASDHGITTENWCTKCYKVWGAVTNPKWGYLAC